MKLPTCGSQSSPPFDAFQDGFSDDDLCFPRNNERVVIENSPFMVFAVVVKDT